MNKLKKSNKNQKNRILFINPPQSCHISLEYNGLKFPLGFLYMGGILEKNGFKVKILDCPLYYKKKKKIDSEIVVIGLYPEEIKKEIKDFEPDIIGVSCAYTAYESDSFNLIKIIKESSKEVNKKFLIVVGGAHASANPSYVLRNKNIDLVIIGEGEETILEIAKKYRKENLININGTAMRDKNKIKINLPRKRIENLDEIKAAWHLLDMDMYFKHPDNSLATMRSPSVDIITSRGCPRNCVFCSIRTVWTRVWKSRSAKNVVDEMEFLNKKYGLSQFRIQDDNLTLDRKRIINICDEIVKRKLDLRWDTPNGVAFWTLDEEVLRKMKKAGCYRITLGIESCSLKTQEYIKKIVDLNKVKSIINLCHKIGIWVCATFIIGFPYENKQDIEETKNFIINSNVNFIFLYIAQPYQGTDLYEDFKKENLLPKFEHESNVFLSKYNTKHFTNERLNKMRFEILKEFYKNRVISYLNLFAFYREFLSKIRNYEEFKYTLKNFYNFIFVLKNY